MGTFHDGLGELHGITVVVQLTGERVAIGRCHQVTDREILLMDADLHEEKPGTPTRDEFVRRAAEVGVWARHPRLVLPMSEVASITPLGEIPS